ncbi:hypothetical protein FA359_28625, partial [Pseudomonas aeruginosa]|nr:hypothetical protein [Pseudomonas aeruginosa]
EMQRSLVVSEMCIRDSRILIEGQRVEFSVVQRDKGLQAEDVIASRR